MLFVQWIFVPIFVSIFIESIFVLFFVSIFVGEG
jgi:hypothetical protein